MPFFTVTTSFSLNEKEKEKVAWTITKSTVEVLKVAPDKIQVLLQSKSRENFSRAGAILSNNDFSTRSRETSFEKMENYHVGALRDEEMVIIELDIWQNFSVDEKTILGTNITRFFYKEFDINRDNILILVRDMEPANWIQSGISGVNQDFLELSRTNM
ncbi:hypothetical protein [Enterococcus sp. AZ007]|uniref:hypothetical protein n=1 Tax=Enterococcus sp. AZ007 TaxID=2774839 RepID=UPI003F2330EB